MTPTLGASDRAEIDRLVAAAPKAVLATIGGDRAPNLVPVTFALDGDVLYTAVDHKPKRTRRLQRLVDIEADPRVNLLVDAYDEDWSRLWWCRMGGTATIIDRHPVAERLLEAKYPQYIGHPIQGPVIVISVTTRSGWHA